MLTLCYSFHATSVDNETGRASGHAHVPLSALGRQQALELGQRYATEAPAAVFSSDLQRASMTAEIAFSERDLPLVQDARLRECDYGDLTQYPFTQIEAERKRRITEPFPNGESISMVVQRVGAFLRAVLRDYDGKTIVVIGHGATKWAVDYWCSDASLEEIVHAPYVWRDTNIWRYELDINNLERRSINR
ncbi:MAG: histidine phosphatase family protein [Chloroflexota bacterium]|nr:histidine phosphatase family protein [Chloroflexota bacterium]